MDANQNQQPAFEKLVLSLEELTKNYRSLLENVRNEKEFLVKADIEKLQQNTVLKEEILKKLRVSDMSREKYALELGTQLNIESQSPRLLEMAQKIGGAASERLRTLHSTLTLLVERTTSLNKENEEYAQKALGALNGALNNIKDTLAGNKTYAKKGNMISGPEQAGNFVSKEA